MSDAPIFGRAFLANVKFYDMKRKPKKPELETFFVSVHSRGAPHILRAICKESTKDEAVEVSRKLWAMSVEPYMARITNEQLEDVFYHKKSI